MGGRGSGGATGRLNAMTQQEVDELYSEHDVEYNAMENDIYWEENYGNLTRYETYSELTKAFEEDLGIRIDTEEYNYTEDMNVPLNVTYHTLKTMKEKGVDVGKMYDAVVFSRKDLHLELDSWNMANLEIGPKGNSLLILNDLQTDIGHFNHSQENDYYGNWSLTSDFSTTIVHEVGHAVSNYLRANDVEAWYDLGDRYRSINRAYDNDPDYYKWDDDDAGNPNATPSDYAKRNENELFAESFVAVYKQSNSGVVGRGSSYVEATRWTISQAMSKTDGTALFTFVKEPIIEEADISSIL